MNKNRVLVIILLAGLLFSSGTSGAQIVHEDPDSLPERPPYDADQKLALSLQEMFGSLDSFVEHINASEFPASRRDIRLFMASYDDFTEVYQRSGLNGTDMEAVATKLAFMADDLNATMERSESYSVDLERFREYMDSNDTQNATQLAARLQLTYRNVSDAVRTVNANTTGILMMLDHTDIDTSGLEKSIVGLGNFTASVEENNRKPSGLLGNSSLAIASSSGEVAAGDSIVLSGILRVNGNMLSGRLIRFYVDGAPAGDAWTDGSGACVLLYRVDGRSFNRTMRVSAEFDPQGDPLSPAISNLLEIARVPEQALLQTRVTPATAVYGDVVDVTGRLTTASGVPAAGQTVTISAGNTPAGVAVTGIDGSFAFPLAVRHDMPAGNCPIQSVYEAAPDCILMNTSSDPAIVAIAPDVSRITLSPPPTVCQGGERVAFQGTLTAGSGRPVTMANVSIFAGDVPMGVCTTDTGGRYSLVATVPYDITPGSHEVHASFDPGADKALAGSRSETYTSLFEPAAPQIAVRGVPAVIFPGDRLNVTGIVMAADGSPIGGRAVSIRVPGAVDASAVTDAGGSYQIACTVGGSPGVYSLSISTPGEGLLSGNEQAAGTVVVMPFDRAGMALIAIAIMLIVSLGFMRVAGRRVSRRTTPVSGKAVSFRVTVKPETRPARYSIEGEIGKIEPAIAGDGNRREAMLAIYRIARLMLRARDPTLPESATHREIYQVIAGRRPSLSASLGTITGHYEDAAFGHFPLTREEVVSSLRSLNEIKGQLYDDGGKAK